MSVLGDIRAVDLVSRIGEVGSIPGGRATASSNARNVSLEVWELTQPLPRIRISAYADD